MRDLRVTRGSAAWPAGLASQAVGVLGVRGSGKSTLGRVYAEELFASGIPFVVFDPIGNWFGIRAGRDGKPDGGIPIPIFGGEHGDLQLDRASGARIADLVIDRRLSCVLDLSHADFSETDKRRFLVDFGDRLFRRKSRESGWLTLIMEEADDYAPQQARGPILPECLGMFQRIVKRGRFKGLGALLITQRSAAINKDLLYMVGTLVAFRTTGPRDQDAIAGWVKHNAIGETVVETLPTLEDGQAWVIAPESLGSIETVLFRRMQTYDTGATPEHGGQAKPATLADIDVPALTKELSEAAERRKAEDPKELRRRIAELERKVAEAAKQPNPKADPARQPKPREVPILKDAQVKRLEAAVDSVRDAAASLLKAHAHQVDQLSQRLQVVVTEAGTLRDQIKAVTSAAARDAQMKTGNVGGGGSAGAARAAGLSRPAPVVPRREPVEGVTPAKQRILDGLAFLAAIGVPQADKTQLALLADARPTSGSYFNNLGALRSAGLVAYPAPNRVELTDAGRAIADASTAPTTTEELHRIIKAKLEPAKWKILEALIKAYPEHVAKDELARRCGARETSGSYFNNLGSLRSLGLIDYPVPGMAAARPVLFLEGE